MRNARISAYSLTSQPAHCRLCQTHIVSIIALCKTEVEEVKHIVLHHVVVSFNNNVTAKFAGFGCHIAGLDYKCYLCTCLYVGRIAK